MAGVESTRFCSYHGVFLGYIASYWLILFLCFCAFCGNCFYTANWLSRTIATKSTDGTEIKELNGRCRIDSIL